MFTIVAGPPRAYGCRWWNSRNARSAHRSPESDTYAHRPPSRLQTPRRTARGMERDSGGGVRMSERGSGAGLGPGPVAIERVSLVLPAVRDEFVSVPGRMRSLFAAPALRRS